MHSHASASAWAAWHRSGLTNLSPTFNPFSPPCRLSHTRTYFIFVLSSFAIQSATMPSIGLGTWLAPPGEVRGAVAAALKLGYRHVDAASVYGNEAEVGEALRSSVAEGVVARADVFLTSKLWVTECSGTDEQVASQVRAALTKGLSALGTSYLDLYLVHWPFFLRPGCTTFPPPLKADVLGYDRHAYLRVWRALEAEVDAGRVRAIGVSNHSAKKIADLWDDARIKPAVAQVEAHPFLAQSALLRFCAARGIVVTAYSPLGSPARPARLKSDEDPSPLTHPVLAGIATKHGVTPAQVLLRWAVQRGTVAIPKSVTPSRLASNLDVFSFALEESDVAALGALDCNARLIKGAPFLSEGMDDWRELWDLDYDAELLRSAAAAPAAAL